jgi:hypothetical protein
MVSAGRTRRISCVPLLFVEPPPSPPAPLCQHLEANGVEFMQFAFRWMNCILMREVPLHCIIRLVGHGAFFSPERRTDRPLLIFREPLPK